MRVIDIILESNGIRAGVPGEPYTDPSGIEYKFQSWNADFPPAADKYPTSEDMQADILALTGNDKNKIIWVNPQAAVKSKSFGVAMFATDPVDGAPQQEIWVGQFFQSKRPTNTIRDMDIKASSGLRAGAAGKPSSASVKQEAQLNPFNLGIADGGKKSINTIIKAVSQHVQGPMLSAGLVAVVNGKPVVFKDGAKIKPALQDDFGEVISPVAMISGHPSVKGDLAKAVADIFQTPDLSGASIRYPVSQTNGLVDSYITIGGQEMGVSSKGGQGANGTINNVWKAKEFASKTVNGQTTIATFPEAVEILDICKKHQKLAPLELGLKYNLIDNAEYTALQALMKNQYDPKQQLSGDTANPARIVKPAMPHDLAKVPVELQRVFNLGGYKAGSFVGFICLARVASLVAQHVNADQNINFGEAIRQFLNSSAMVQVTCTMGTANGDAVLNTIGVKYPPNFTEKAKMESNWYSGKQCKGGFSFSLPKR